MKPLSFVLLLAIMLTACAPAPTPTATPVPPPRVTVPPPTATVPPPTATPIPPAATVPPPTATVTRLSKSPTLILAVDKPFRKNVWPGNVVYMMPEMDKTLLASELTYYKDLTVDIYYPPDYSFQSKLPVVILSHGFQDGPSEVDKDMPSHIDWAKLIAASGMIAVSAQAGDAPGDNSYHVLDFLGANADVLGLDLTRIGYWACSGQGLPAFTALEDKTLPYRNGFKAALFNYLDLSQATPSNWPAGFSMIVVRAGKDAGIPASTINDFVARARASNLPLEYIELADAEHGFDIYQNNQISKDVVKHELEFLQSQLLGTKPPTPAISPSPAQPASPEELRTRAEAGIQAAVEKWGLPGLSGSILVVRQGKVILRQAYGLADRDKQTPNTPETKFRIAHLTRAFTATGILMLQEQGKLKVNDPLCTYLKDCPEAWKPVTLQHLLSLSSGIPDTLISLTSSADQALTAAKTLPLTSPPGEKLGWGSLMWSGTNYLLLGKVIEAVSGQTYEAFVQKNILDPLRMSHTGFTNDQPDLALGYPDNQKKVGTGWPPQALYADGALYSTVDDLYLWDQALYTNSLLSEKSVEALFEPHLPDSDVPGCNMAYGGFEVCSEQGQQFAFGYIESYVSAWIRYPKDRISVIILFNEGDVDVGRIANGIMDQVFGYH